jgi:CelD/BcsL family acetyltransferase involved in cellulose biosynthesis
MPFKLIPGRHIDSGLAKGWRELQDANTDLESPCFSPEFTQAAAAARDDLEVAIVEEDGLPLAFFPFQRGKRKRGIPAGGIVSDYQGIICAPGFVCDLQQLLKSCRLVTWDFDRLVASQELFVPYHKRCEPSAIIDVSGGYDAYVAERRAAGSAQIKKAEAMARRIERELGPLRFVAHSSDERILAQVLQWKSQQYCASGWTDLFADRWARTLVQVIHSTQRESFSGMLSLLYGGDKLLAGHMGMRSQSVWHYWFPAYDRQFAKYSPGLILLLRMAQQARQFGLRRIDLGTGLTLYKQRLMNASVSVAEGSVERPSWLWVKRGVRRQLKSLLVKTANLRAGPNTDPVGGNLSGFLLMACAGHFG